MNGSVYLSRKMIFGLLLLAPSLLVAEEKVKQGIDVVQEIHKCKKNENNTARLICFDQLAIRFSPPRYKGRLSKVTDVFTLDKPHKLRYRSYGVIFVLYLRDTEGNVLQNLHIGGTGEDSYLIEEPGSYTLKIQGSDNWEVWIEPEDETSELSE